MPATRRLRTSSTWLQLEPEHLVALDNPFVWVGCGDASYARSRSSRMRAILEHYDAHPWRCAAPKTDADPADPRIELYGLAREHHRVVAWCAREWGCSTRQVYRRLLAGWLRRKA